MAVQDATVKKENIKVHIETEQFTIIGTVRPSPQAYRSRLSDLLNQKDTLFLSVTDAKVYKSDNLEEPFYSTSFVAINVSKIEIVRPAAEE
jgi:hypothetical protein